MANGMEIASLFAKVGADVGDFEKSMKQVKSDMSGLEKGFGGLQNAATTSFKAIGIAGVAAFGAVAAGMTKAITEAGNMEQQAANISAVFGNMAPPVDEVKTLINQLALDPSLVIGIEDAGAGLEMLAKNGLTWDQIAQGAARSTILMANATGADLSMSADLATNALGIFQLQVSDLDNVVATFTNSANKSQFTVNDWGYVLANAGPAANAFGYDLEELFAAVTLTSSGFASGREAGTSFEYLLKGLTPSTVTAKDEMKKLGLMTEDGANAFFNADGSAKALDETMRILQDAFGGLSQEQAMSSSEAIFGATAYGALQGILNMNLDTYRELVPQMTDFSAVEAGAETRTRTFQGAMSALNDTINSVFVMVGDKFLPVVTDLARHFADFVKTHAPKVIEFFGDLADRVDSMIVGFMSAKLVYEDGAGALKVFLKELGLTNEMAFAITLTVRDMVSWFENTRASIQSNIQPLVEIITQFFSWKDILAAVAVVIASIVIPAIGAFLGAITPIIAVFAALVAASALLRNAWENDWFGIRSITDRTINYVMDLFGPLLSTIRDFGGEALGEIVAWATGNETQFVAVGRIWDAAKELARNLFDDLKEFVTDNLPIWIDKLKQWGIAAWEWIQEAVPAAVKRLGEWGRALWGWVQDNLPKWMDNLRAWGTAAWQWISDIIPPALARLGEWGSKLLNWLAAHLPDFIRTIFEWGTALVEWITDAIPGAINNLAGFVRGLRDEGEGNGLQSFLQMAGKWASALWRWIVDELIPEAGPAYLKFMAAMAKYGLELLGALGNLAKELGLTLWQWIVDVTPVALRKIGEWGAALWNWIKENAPVWREKLGEWARAAWEWITQTAIPEARKKLGEWGTSLMDWLRENAPIWRDKLLEIGRNLVDGLRKGIEEKFLDFKQWWNNYGPIRSLIDLAADMLGIHSPSTVFRGFGENIMIGLQDGIDAYIPPVLNTVKKLADDVGNQVKNIAKTVGDSLKAAEPALRNYYKDLLDAKIAALELASRPILPPAPVTSLPKPPPLADPNAGGNGQVIAIPQTPTAGNDMFGTKSFGLGLMSAAGFVDISDTIEDLAQFAGKARAFLTAPGQPQLQGSSAESHALDALAGAGVDNLSVNHVLAAIQTLIRKLDEQGFGAKFNISMAPDASAPQSGELEALVAYLNALYG